jgi:DNA mismatch endonuclease (patch repair protein)
MNGNNMDKLTKKQRSELMSKIKSKKTKPEIAIHNVLKGNKIGHKMNPKMVGNPDVVIKEVGIVIFINGCFWHGCKKHFRLPKTNIEFWNKKIKRNIERQKESIKELKKFGYKSVIIWEHDLL